MAAAADAGASIYPVRVRTRRGIRVETNYDPASKEGESESDGGSTGVGEERD